MKRQFQSRFQCWSSYIKVAGFVRTVFAGGDLGELAGEGRRMVEKEFKKKTQRTYPLLPTYGKFISEMISKSFENKGRMHKKERKSMILYQIWEGGLSKGSQKPYSFFDVLKRANNGL